MADTIDTPEPVDKPNRIYLAHAPRWLRMRDALSGRDGVIARCLSPVDDISAGGGAISRYVPRLEAMDAAAYLTYLSRGVWYASTARTLDGLTGAVFARVPAIELPPALAAIEEDATAEHLPLAVFAQQVFREVLGIGRYVVVVDLPEDGGLVPYLNGYAAENVLDWRLDPRHGRMALTRLVLREQVLEPDAAAPGRWVPAWQFRVYELAGGGCQLTRWRYASDADGQKGRLVPLDEAPLAITRHGMALSYIPAVCVGSATLGWDIARPPLLDMADINLHHYRLSCDLNQGLFVTSLPQPVVIGDHSPPVGQGVKRRIGVQTVWELPAGASASYLEFSGAGLAAIRHEIEMDEARMTQMGARLIEPQKRAAETAEALRLRQAGEAATLMTMAEVVGWGLTKALGYAAEWVDMDPATAWITLSREYVDTTMSEQDAVLAMQRWQSGAATLDDLYYLYKRGGRIEPEITLDEWRRKLADEQPALPAADADAGDGAA